MSQFVGFNWKIFVIVTITVFTILLVNWNTSKTSFVQELNKPRKLSRTDHEHEHSYIHARFSHHYSKPKSRFVYQAPDKGKKTKPGHKSLFIHRQPKFIEIKENVKVFDDAFPQCEFKIVETIPKVLESKGIRSHHISTFNAFLELVQNAQESFAMMSQWAIDGSGKDKYIFKAMEESIKEKYVNMDIGFNNHANFAFQANFSPYHLLSMQNYKGQVNLREPNIEGKITPRHKGNMIHSKIFLTDRKDFYIGSANIGSRCLSRTKELGILVKNCPVLGQDVRKQLDLYYSISKYKDPLPESFPLNISSVFNIDHPLEVRNSLDEATYKMYIASSPKELCASGRSTDLEAILDIISKANKYIYISVGEYLPYMIYKYPLNRWTVIHDKLNQVMSKRKVQIKFLVNDHASHAKLMFDALKELKGDFFEAKMFKSTFDKKHFHGSHTKYMVTDTAALIGTSNWSGDYFSDTAGVSVIMEPIASTVNPKKISLLGTLKRIFERDFYSSLAKKIY